MNIFIDFIIESIPDKFNMLTRAKILQQVTEKRFYVENK
jgi:hypothetical protein